MVLFSFILCCTISSSLVLQFTHFFAECVFVGDIKKSAVPAILYWCPPILFNLHGNKYIQHRWGNAHYHDVIMDPIASQITSLTIVYSIVYSDADERKHQSSASLAFVWGIHRDRWIPRTKGQLRGKCFHLMTSSWDENLLLGSWPSLHLEVGRVYNINIFRYILHSFTGLPDVYITMFYGPHTEFNWRGARGLSQYKDPVLSV